MNVLPTLALATSITYTSEKGFINIKYKYEFSCSLFYPNEYKSQESIIFVFNSGKATLICFLVKLGKDAQQTRYVVKRKR